MSGIHEISAYQQAAEAWKTEQKRIDSAKTTENAKTSKSYTATEAKNTKVSLKPWNPLSETSSLIPRKTDYGFAIGDVKLSDTAADYYSKLKAKFGNMEFIVVSKDMKAQVQANAAAYGNARKQVVLIDDEKLERMATDEDYRNKYEGIIAMSQAKLLEAKNSLASSGAAVKNFGMSVASDGTEKFFATVEKSQELQKERIERKAEEKRAHKKAEEKKARKEAEKERIEKNREERRAEKKEAEERIRENDEDASYEDEVIPDEKEYVTLSSDSLKDLVRDVQVYSYDSAAGRVKTEAERMVGSHIDFKG